MGSTIFVFDKNYLEKKRAEIQSEIAYARYEVAGMWFESKIEAATVLTDGRIEVTFLIDYTKSNSYTVTTVELYDYNGLRIGSKSVNITRKNNSDGILYSCRFSLFQIKESVNNTGAYDAL
nr:hypothetical protein [uncultured Blautia sp.]